MSSFCFGGRISSVEPSGLVGIDEMIGAEVKLLSSDMINTICYEDLKGHETFHISSINFRLSLDGQCFTILQLEELPGRCFTLKDIKIVELNEGS